MVKYVTHIEVSAVQWTGNNLSEMKDLLKNFVCYNSHDGYEVYVEEIEPFYTTYMGKRPGYSMLKFYAWGDDQEVDPGQWVVVYSDGEGEIMEDEEFIKMGFMKK